MEARFKNKEIIIISKNPKHFELNDKPLGSKFYVSGKFRDEAFHLEDFGNVETLKIARLTNK
jgi:hypothetical protein